jgi:Fanconi anemia group M protein
MHCLELLQTQGIKPLAQFLEGMKKEIKRVKANRCLFEDLEFKEAMRRVFDLEAKNIEHPKFEKLVSIVNNFKKPKSRIIIFTHYRNTADRIITFLTEQTNSKPVKFIGQKSGMSQKEQVQVINDFKDGIYNVLVATSIAEEGLHIENADLGIFFEPVPSALRTIQRRGRIGRVNIGKIILLITKDTIDEKYFWVAFHKERRMKETLDEIREEIKDGAQSRLTGF